MKSENEYMSFCLFCAGYGYVWGEKTLEEGGWDCLECPDCEGTGLISSSKAYACCGN